MSIARTSSHGVLQLLALALLVVTAAPLSVSWEYAVIIDAGSSGSRVHVFRYYGHKDTPWPTVELPSGVHKTSPGLSAYAFDPKTAASSLEPLLRFAKQAVPADQVATTPVQLYATAGLRALPNDTSARLLAAVAGTLASSGFRFQPGWARIASGREEGLWGWLGVNYARGALGGAAHDPVPSLAEATALGRKGGPGGNSSSSSSQAPPGLMGVLELGGGSMQVTFLPPPGAKVPPADAYPIPGLTGALPPTPATPTTAAAAGSSKQPAQSGQAQVVYTHSFDGLGLQAMLSNWSASLPPGAPDPCLPAGFTSSEGVVGAGQWGACRKGLAGLLPRAKGAACSWAAWGGCGLGNTYTPPLAGLLLGIDNVFYTGDALGLPAGPGAAPASLAAYEGAGAAWCGTPWAALHQRHKRRVPDFYLPKVCFGAALVSVLLREGLAAPPSAPLLALSNSVATPKGNPVAVSWPLGALLAQVVAAGGKPLSSSWTDHAAVAAAAAAGAAKSAAAPEAVKAKVGAVAAAALHGGFSPGMSGGIAALYCLALIVVSLGASAARVGVISRGSQPGAGHGGRGGYGKVRTTLDDVEEGELPAHYGGAGGPRGDMAPQVLVSTGRRQQGLSGNGNG